MSVVSSRYTRSMSTTPVTPETTSTGLRLDHLRYLEKCGLVKPAFRNNADTFFGFSDLTTLRQLAGELHQGEPRRLDQPKLPPRPRPPSAAGRCRRRPRCDEST